MESSLFKANHNTRHEGITEANRILTNAVEAHFTIEEPQLRKQLLDAGFNPESIDNEINKIMRQLKLQMIEVFKKNLGEIVSEKIASSSPRGSNLPS